MSFLVLNPVIWATLVDPKKSARSLSSLLLLSFSLAHHLGIMILVGLSGDGGLNGDGGLSGDNGLIGDFGDNGDTGDFGDNGDLGLAGDLGLDGLAGDGLRGENAEPDFGENADLGDTGDRGESADLADALPELIDFTLAEEPDIDLADLAEGLSIDLKTDVLTDGILYDIILGDSADRMLAADFG